MAEPEIDPNLIEKAVLALMYLTLHSNGRAWKGFDWAAMGRLHDKHWISNPVGNAKSVALTEERLRRSEEAYVRLFSIRKKML